MESAANLERSESRTADGRMQTRYADLFALLGAGANGRDQFGGTDNCSSAQ
jgi:hypothetical protein